MSKRVEFRVRPVTRWIVTRYEESESGNSGAVSERGEYGGAEVAYEVGYALAKAEHDALGYPPGDERIQYPQRVIYGPGLNGAVPHYSDCAVYNAPAMEPGPCNCGLGSKAA